MNTPLFFSIKKMIDVNTPIIYIQDYDYVRVDELITSSINKSSRVHEWNPAVGLIDFRTKEMAGNGVETTLVACLRNVYTPEMSLMERYLVLRDIHDQIEESEVKSLLQMIAQRKLYDRDFNTTIIIVSSVLKIPHEIEKYVSILEIPFPTDDDINALIDEHIEINGYDNKQFTDEDRNKLMPSLKGLTKFEIDRMLDMAMSSGGTLSAEDKEMILRHKKQMVKKSGVLELVDSPESIDSIGGLDALKKYLEKKSGIMRQLGEAMAFNVAVPKGVFLVGMPGCGKSLCAKAAATLFEVPLLKMDMGSLMGKYVGESEENMRKAVKIAEAAAPCILWIDEIEKAFAGVGGGNSEILTRMFGHFLSWMQEKTSSVYVVATANNANNLPPELKRKGRFDEIFCVNLPNDDERKKIFEVHLKKRKKFEECVVTSQIITATKGFNGADIESVVNEAVEECFVDGRKKLTSDILLKIAKDTISISKSCKKQIEDMEKVFKESSFKDASAKQKEICHN